MKQYIKAKWLIALIVVIGLLVLVIAACWKNETPDNSKADNPPLPIDTKSLWYSERLVTEVLADGLLLGSSTGLFYKTIPSNVACVDYKLPDNCHEKFFTFTSYGYGLEIVVNDLTNIRIDEKLTINKKRLLVMLLQFVIGKPSSGRTTELVRKAVEGVVCDHNVVYLREASADAEFDKHFKRNSLGRKVTDVTAMTAALYYAERPRIPRPYYQNTMLVYDLPTEFLNVSATNEITIGESTKELIKSFENKLGETDTLIMVLTLQSSLVSEVKLGDELDCSYDTLFRLFDNLTVIKTCHRWSGISGVKYLTSKLVM